MSLFGVPTIHFMSLTHFTSFIHVMDINAQPVFILHPFKYTWKILRCPCPFLLWRLAFMPQVNFSLHKSQQKYLKIVHLICPWLSQWLNVSDLIGHFKSLTGKNNKSCNPFRMLWVRKELMGSPFKSQEKHCITLLLRRVVTYNLSFSDMHRLVILCFRRHSVGHITQTWCGEIVALRKEIYKPMKFLLIFVVHTQSIHQNLQKNILFEDIPLYEVENLLWFYWQIAVLSSATECLTLYISRDKHSGQMALVTYWARTSRTESQGDNAFGSSHLSVLSCLKGSGHPK